MSEIIEDQKIVLYLKTVDNTQKEFVCFVKKIQKDRISLRFPNDVLDYSEYLEEGSELEVKIFTPSGVKAFETIVIDSPLENEFVIEFDENYIEIQRRQYLRAELETKIILESESIGVVVTTTIDISGGGVRFLSDRQFRPKDRVRVMLYLPYQMTSVKALGEIIENKRLPENQFVVLFTEIEERERERIVKQCFETQAESYK